VNVKDIMPWKGGGKPSLTRPSSLLDEFFERGFGFGREMESFSPTVDVAEKEGEIEVTAELPGLEEKDIEVTVDEHGLSLRGEKKQERKEEGENYYRMERSFGSFQRYIPLTGPVDREKVKARFKNGVLKIHLPKAGEGSQKGKKIRIEA
jgi:HSP20 family protein